MRKLYSFGVEELDKLLGELEPGSIMVIEGVPVPVKLLLL